MVVVGKVREVVENGKKEEKGEGVVLRLGEEEKAEVGIRFLIL